MAGATSDASSGSRGSGATAAGGGMIGSQRAIRRWGAGSGKPSLIDRPTRTATEDPAIAGEPTLGPVSW